MRGGPLLYPQKSPNHRVKAPWPSIKTLNLFLNRFIFGAYLLPSTISVQDLGRTLGNLGGIWSTPTSIAMYLLDMRLPVWNPGPPTSFDHG